MTQTDSLLTTIEHQVSVVGNSYREVYNNLVGEYPKKPQKPRISSNPTAESLKKSAEEFAEYEALLNVYNVAVQRYRTKASEVAEIFQTVIRQQTRLDKVPEKYREKVYDLAYERGHSEGYDQLFYELKELVEGIFE